MDAVAELGRNPLSKHQIQPKYGDEQLTRGGTAEPVSRDQILRRERGQGNSTSRFGNLTRLIRTLDIPWQVCVIDHTI